jgi:hypothetical protein
MAAAPRTAGVGQNPTLQLGAIDVGFALESGEYRRPLGDYDVTSTSALRSKAAVDAAHHLCSLSAMRCHRRTFGIHSDVGPFLDRAAGVYLD